MGERTGLRWHGDEPVDYQDAEVRARAHEVRTRVRSGLPLKQNDLYWLYRWERKFVVSGDREGWEREWSDRRRRVMGEAKGQEWEPREARRRSLEEWKEAALSWAEQYQERLQGELEEERAPLVAMWVMGIKTSQTRGDVERSLKELAKLCGHYEVNLNVRGMGGVQNPREALRDLMLQMRGVNPN